MNQVQVTLTFPNVGAAVAALASLTGAGAVALEQPIKITEAPGKPEKAAKTEPKTADKPTAQPEPKPTAPAKSETSSPAASQSPASGEALDYDKDVRPLVIKAGGVKGRDAMLELLAKFGVGKGSEVKPEQLPAFKADLEALIG
jgi:hypothetical protein